jgi:hypothetical protein
MILKTLPDQSVYDVRAASLDRGSLILGQSPLESYQITLAIYHSSFAQVPARKQLISAILSLDTLTIFVRTATCLLFVSVMYGLDYF